MPTSRPSGLGMTALVVGSLFLAFITMVIVIPAECPNCIGRKHTFEEVNDWWREHRNLPRRGPHGVRMGALEDCLRCSNTGIVRLASAWLERPPAEISPVRTVRTEP